MSSQDQHGNPDYLAKDFNSFRGMMLDHLARAAPNWTERHAADLGVTLVEALAYVADYLSYYQDAVAAEAYLATARQRASVKRHARLMDYCLKEAISARVWVQLNPARDGVSVQKGAALLTRMEGMPVQVSEETYVAYDGDVFETMHDIALFRESAVMRLAARSEPLEAGDASAQLIGQMQQIQRGDVLLLRHSKTGYCHPVRLTGVAVAANATAIEWRRDDALPVDAPRSGDWVALGNIVLADHGRTTSQALPAAPPSGDYAPTLDCRELAHAAPYDHQAAMAVAAAAMLRCDPSLAEPAALLEELPKFDCEPEFPPRPAWMARRDILHARASDRYFVAEPTGRGTVRLRFGDGARGRKPQPEWNLRAVFRVGGGARGNIGAGALAHIVGADNLIVGVANWLAGAGGSDPESLAEAKWSAPLERDGLRRCVTPDDYRAIALTFPGVSETQVERRPQGVRKIVTIRVKRVEARPVDARFIADLVAYLAPVRLIGDALQIVPMP